MEDGLAEAIDEGKIGPRDDPKVSRQQYTDTYSASVRLAGGAAGASTALRRSCAIRAGAGGWGRASLAHHLASPHLTAATPLACPCPCLPARRCAPRSCRRTLAGTRSWPRRSGPLAPTPPAPTWCAGRAGPACPAVQRCTKPSSRPACWQRLLLHTCNCCSFFDSVLHSSSHTALPTSRTAA